VLAGQVPEAAALGADLTFISVGTNDLIRQVPLTRIEANLEMIVARMRPVSRIVMLAGIGDLGTIPRLLPPIRHLASRRGQRADRVHARVADRNGALKAEMWGTAAHAFRTQPGIFSPDLFHPTAAGHAVWAEAAWAALESHLDRPTEEHGATDQAR
jgi:lysophospholipase L1-like esterase